MKTAYNVSCTLKNATLEQELALCQAAGFDAISLRIDKLRAYLRRYTRDELQSFFRKSALRPCAMVGIHAYTGLFGPEDDPEKNRRFLEDFRFGCELLCALGARDMIVVPPLFTEEEGRDYDLPWSQRMAENIRIFTRLSEMARDYGVRLGIKIIDAPRCSIRTVAECNAILDRIPGDNVGYTLDPFNFFLHGGNDNLETLRQLRGDRIFVVHVNGAAAGATLQRQRTFPDEGELDVDRYLKILAEKGYDGPVCLDISRPELWEMSPAGVIARGAESLRTVLARNHLYHE